MSGVATCAASEIISGFDKCPELLRHERPLLLCKGTCCKFAFEHSNKFDDCFFCHGHGKGSLCHSAARSVGEFILHCKYTLINICKSQSGIEACFVMFHDKRRNISEVLLILRFVVLDDLFCFPQCFQFFQKQMEMEVLSFYLT